MVKKKKLQERRKHQRFKVKKGAFAVSSPYYNKLGQIHDISKGGLAFHYIGKTEPVKVSDEVEIFSNLDDFYLRKLPVETVLDIELENTVSFSSLPTRKLSIKFGKLSYNQKLLLDHFIQSYTHPST